MKIPILACLCLFVALSSHAELAGTKPNIILVITDDQGYPAVGAHGHPWLKTPHLDTLHGQSTRFSRFLVAPTCTPTRSSLMTGRHPEKNGITHTILERERMTLDATILPQVLKTAGYTSGIFGKWHLGDEDPYQPNKRGFDEVFIHGAGGIGQAYKCSCADAPGNKYFDPVIRHNGSFVKTKGYCTDLFFTAALGWIKEKKDQDTPFFAYITTNAPHSPFIAPPSNTKRFTDLGFQKQTAGFYGMIENIDENMGRLQAKLDEWKLMDNTILIFMSDNGMTGGGSGTPKKPLGKLPDGTPMDFYNAGQKGLKASADEGGVRVPFFIRWDGKSKPGRNIDTLSAHLDILPTLAEIAGAKLPADQVEGRSFLPLLDGTKTGLPDRILFTQGARWATGSEPNLHQWTQWSARNQRFRLVGDDLFDMIADPGQATNVADQHPEVIKEMRSAYDKFWREARPLMVNEDAPMSKTQPFHVWYNEQLKNGGIPDWTPPTL